MSDPAHLRQAGVRLSDAVERFLESVSLIEMIHDPDPDRDRLVAVPRPVAALALAAAEAVAELLRQAGRGVAVRAVLGTLLDRFPAAPLARPDWDAAVRDFWGWRPGKETGLLDRSAFSLARSLEVAARVTRERTGAGRRAKLPWHAFPFPAR
jgi:hypothetical protein